jgi:formylmethanofuran dehydrogenase subunit E
MYSHDVTPLQTCAFLPPVNPVADDTLGEEPDIEELYARAAQLHGHMCPGVVLGTRMAVLGMGLLGLPPGVPDEALTTYIETARCATDAVQATTGCSPGRHSLKVLNFGKMAATFALAGEEGGFRVVALESSREEADRLHPEVEGRRARQLAAYRELADDRLFEVERVRLLAAPGRPHRAPRTKATCPRCGEVFEERHGVPRADGRVCASCAGWSYYTRPSEPTRPSDAAAHRGGEQMAYGATRCATKSRDGPGRTM